MHVLFDGLNKYFYQRQIWMKHTDLMRLTSPYSKTKYCQDMLSIASMQMADRYKCMLCGYEWAAAFHTLAPLSTQTKEPLWPPSKQYQDESACSSAQGSRPLKQPGLGCPPTTHTAMMTESENRGL